LGSAFGHRTAANTHYYGVGIEHLAFEVDEREEVDAGLRALRRARGQHPLPT
jgi:hypothetical protein